MELDEESMILFWGRWRGSERLLWHPRGGYVRPVDALPPRLAASLPDLAGAQSGAWVEDDGGRRHTWTTLPVPGGVFLAVGRHSAGVMRDLARAEFRELPGVGELLGEGQ